ncbi:MAG: ribosome maturation factor RimP [Bacillota bacterium]|jgi:ribosome maturation factor RimP|nr:ribosome maturation factor RimP [Bacillota bacterium]HOO29535.1 ribosome maturation factor RimP [Bacillota bacterium]HPZ12897.1 ribosome maturation factor RimP [Bacillota bacterium]HQD79311.1 ribosome maturation factor RimP [Bacillota bacterium]
MDRRQIESRANAISQSAADSLGLEVVDTEFVKDSGTWYLRVYIEKPGGVGIDDCADLSRLVGSELDREDFIPQSYILEVSSSGEKPIRRDEEYDRFEGRWALITTYKEIDGRKRFEGVLRGNRGDSVLIEVDGVVVQVPRSSINTARLAVRLEEVFGDD